MIDINKVFEICKDSYEIVDKVENSKGEIEIHCSYLDWTGNKCKEFILVITDVICIKYFGDVNNLTLKNIEEFSLWVDL